ncbi:hypothetical protein TMES_07365 [Thalassospira mesophila]|uniref:Uncharacterized protein n=2 Tax=Thalassospira mesophila TaxID=1293891 RepID=A0A1Y2L2Q1_9PROT|nr:hypothetical protein TMES_07365 [Thalassospira mesophila]
MEPLCFDHPDPQRAEKEAILRSLDAAEFKALYVVTRKAASMARQNGDMDRLYALTRGLKTLQRISGERGFVLAVRRPSP